MSRLERHITARLLVGFVIATAVLLPLFALFDLAEQLEDVGDGAYGFADALLHVALLLPRRLVQLAPFIALLGGIIGLGLLALHEELVALRAVGLSSWRLRRAAGLAACALGATYAALVVVIAPTLQQHAIERRANLVAGTQDGDAGLGLWARDRQRILHIGAMRHGRVPVDVEIFHLRAGEARLARYVYAAQARVRGDGTWLLRDVTVKRFSASGTSTTERPRLVWEPFLGDRRLGAMQLPPESLSPMDLAGYVAYLRDSGSPAAVYALALWRKAGHGLLAVALVFLAVPFVTGSAPRSPLAPRLMLGALTGIAVFIGDEILANLGLYWRLPAAAVALTPSAVLLAVAVAVADWRR